MQLGNNYYNLLWISSPHNHNVCRPSKKTDLHWQCIQNWLEEAMLRHMTFVLFVPPGPFWEIPNIKKIATLSNAITTKMRLCHFGFKFDPTDARPSGSYLRLTTTAKLSTRLWPCTCKIPIVHHVLDWHGRSEAHARLRQSVTMQLIGVALVEICKEFA